jgi:hypothetical protein
MRLGPTVLALALSSFAAAPAGAQCPKDALGCYDEEVAFLWSDRLFDTIEVDSGWVPSGAPLQVRVGFRLAGETRIEMPATAYAFWPTALSILPVGLADGGRLAIDYGLEITARLRFDVTIAGVRYVWEGDIPLPGGIPRDLRMAGETRWTPFALPGSAPRPVSVRDATAPITALSVSLDSVIGSVAGAVVDGGLSLGLRGELSAAYQGERIDVIRSELPGGPSVPISAHLGAAIVAAPVATGYGAAEDLALRPRGRITYTGTLVAEPTVFVELVGRRFELARFEFPIPIVDTSSEPAFEGAPIHVPLPDVATVEDALAFGRVSVGSRASASVRFRNDGEAELWVRPVSPEPPFEVAGDELRLPPRSERSVPISFAPARAGVVSGLVAFATNDPDRPTFTVRVAGEGGLADAGAGDAAVDGGRSVGVAAGGCGCRAATRTVPTGVELAAALALALLRRRRRGGAHPR